MKNIFMLLLFCHVSSPVKHSFKFYFSASTGIPNFPHFVAALVVDDIQASYCDSNNKTEVKQDAWKKLLDDDPKILEFYSQSCFVIQPNFFKHRLKSFMQLFNQTGGVHSLQTISGCEWDEKTGEVTGSLNYGYDGEDLISLDLKNLTWTALKPQAVDIKQEWDADKDRIKEDKNYLTHIWPGWLKKYLNYSSLLKTDLPSVSLLQKTPSSPVSCHATGFYPDGAVMFWRKDGEELYDDVDHGEILPNHDGTFQMNVDFNISSVRPEDWRRYDCVFHFSGAVNKTIITLDKEVIRTNWVPPSEFSAGAVVGVVVGLLLLAVCITGLFMWKK